MQLLKSVNGLAATLILSLAAAANAQPPAAPASPAQTMAATVLQKWPVSTHDQWAYEEGTLLDGIAAQWHVTANGDDFAYIKAAVDKYVTADGTITTYKASGHTLDDVEMGRATLLLYRVTQQEKYAKAAKFLEDQLAIQPRTASGGYWHKQIYPNQMWLDGAYMAEPFRAAYAATFQQTADFDDIAKQLLLMDEHMRDEKTGLLRHGWDESKAMPWADKTTGLSPEVWARAMGWYCMALVDVLDWFPKDHPQHAALVAALNRNMAAVAKAQDSESGLWWQVMSRAPHTGPAMAKQPDGSIRIGVEHSAGGNYLEASASCMFTYALAKGVRMGYLPSSDGAAAHRAWDGIQKHFVTTNPDGTVTLHGTVKVGGLGGTPYRSGTFEYYIGEPIVDQDAKGVGAFLLAGSEMDQASTVPVGPARAKSGLLPSSKDYRSSGEPASHRITAMVDAWFNSQTRKTAFGQSELFHYKWNDDSNNGYSFFGRAFRRYGATLATLPEAPTAAGLAKAQVYIIASPDIPSKNPAPHYLDKASGDAIEAWVKAGGVLLLFSNDRDNTEFEHFNTLSDRFGMHFNPVLSHHVVEPDHASGEVAIPAGTGIFGTGFTAYMKDTSTITPKGPAKALVTDHGDVMIAIAHMDKGMVLGIVDPWFYNEYADGRKMGQYHGFEAAEDVAAWAVHQSK
ncbi:MAG TPA: glycoside hydrolase family 88 protein [Acidobacteriaceae bacterium]